MSSTKSLPFDKILDEVQKGKYDAGLLIHEGQLTYREMGCTKSSISGEWWLEKTGLPLPLGGNVIKTKPRAGTDEPEYRTISSRASSMASITVRKRYRVRDSVFPRPRHSTRRSVHRHVRQRPDARLRCGRPRGRCGRLLDEAHSKKIIPKTVPLEFV